MDAFPAGNVSSDGCQSVIEKPRWPAGSELKGKPLGLSGTGLPGAALLSCAAPLAAGSLPANGGGMVKQTGLHHLHAFCKGNA